MPGEDRKGQGQAAPKALVAPPAPRPLSGQPAGGMALPGPPMAPPGRELSGVSGPAARSSTSPPAQGCAQGRALDSDPTHGNLPLSPLLLDRFELGLGTEDGPIRLVSEAVATRDYSRWADGRAGHTSGPE